MHTPSSAMSVSLEAGRNGYRLTSSGSPGSPPSSLADMISRNKMLEGKKSAENGHYRVPGGTSV